MVLVQDLSSAKEFYCTLSGFSVVEESDEKIVFSYGPSMIVAFECERPSETGVHGSNASSTTVLTVDDIDVEMDTLRHSLVSFIHKAPASNSLGRYAAFYGPSGIVHELLELKR